MSSEIYHASGRESAFPSDTQAEVSKKFPSKGYIVLPNGLCAGVVRSRGAYRQLRQAFPDETLYSIGEPAHNPTVIGEFRENNWTFVENISEVPPGAKAAFGPHGSTEEDYAIAQERGITYLDTECPLVTYVKRGVREALEDNETIVILFGKRRHAETRAHIGVSDLEKQERIILVESEEEAVSQGTQERVLNPEKVAFFAQTTHNADETRQIEEKLRKLYPSLKSLPAESICFATRNRQLGAKEMISLARQSGERIMFIVMGDETSSNSKELLGVVKKEGVGAVFVNKAQKLNEHLEEFLGFDSLALTAGASVPEEDMQETVEWCVSRGVAGFEVFMVEDESKINFKFPPIRRPHAVQ